MGGIPKNGPASLDERLRFAIAHKRVIQIRYNGKVRLSEPHDYGVQKGIERLFTYQLRAPGPNATGWRLLDTEKIESCEVLDETFKGSRGQSHPTHMTWEVLYARVT